MLLAGRSERRCDQAAAGLAAETGRPVLGHACDVTDEHAVAGLVDRVLSEHGRLDVLVTSAGVQARGTIDQLAVAQLRACLDVNVVGTWLACRAAVGPMRAAGYGRIVTLASASAWSGPRAAPGTPRARARSSSSPAASPSSWPEPGSPSTRSRPGPFRTPLNDGIDDDPHVRRFLDSEVPMRRWAEPGVRAPPCCSPTRSPATLPARSPRRLRLDQSLTAPGAEDHPGRLSRAGRRRAGGRRWSGSTGDTRSRSA